MSSDESIFQRRTLLKTAACAAAAGFIGSVPASGKVVLQPSEDTWSHIHREPDAVVIAADGLVNSAIKDGQGRWSAGTIAVTTTSTGNALGVFLTAPNSAVKQIRLRWSYRFTEWKAFLGDHWERSYGDLRWRSADAFRPAPWYALIQIKNSVLGVGVRTQPNAFCHWRFDVDGITLICDVRSGGVGVELGDRVLHVCDVLSYQSPGGQTPFQAAVEFCKRMCPNPLRTPQQIYGFNDWYYAYGKNTPAGLISDAELLGELTSGLSNRPFCVIDDGWQVQAKAPLGQWSATRPSFIPMDELAAGMKQRGVRPGIWMRPLIDEIRAWPDSWRLSRDRNYLDPTLPEVKNVVATDIRRIRGWGYEMIKHDFSTFDLTGRWGKDMQEGAITADGWSFASRKQTTAEVINDLYATIRQAAGDAVVIGCNTISHMSAGVFAVNRIGDDTSGNEWHRNPQMGVNALAFRAPHQGAFYGADADCCPITTRIDFARTGKWLDLVARSGTPLFVSVERKALTPDVRNALKRALATASEYLPLAEPLDWLSNPIPKDWILAGERVSYDWA